MPAAAAVIDLLCLVVAVLGAALGRDRLGIFATSASDFSPQLMLAAPVVTAGWMLAIALLGGYDRQVFGAGTAEYRRVLRSGLANAALIGVGCYLLKFPLSRGWFVLVFVIGMPLLLLGRVTLRGILKRARQRGLLQHRVLIVGDEEHIDEVASVLTRESWLGYDVIGALAPSKRPRATPRSAFPSSVRPPTWSSTAEELDADVVFFAGGAVASAAQLRQVGWALEHTKTQLVVAPSLTDVSRERVSVRPVGGLPLIHLEKPRSVAAGRKAKRVFDLVGSLTILFLLSPLYLFAAAQIWWHDKRAAAVQAGAHRSRRPDVQVLQVPQHGDRRRGAPRRGARRPGLGLQHRLLQAQGRPARSPRPAAGCGASRSTSCRSC